MTGFSSLFYLSVCLSGFALWRGVLSWRYGYFADFGFGFDVWGPVPYGFCQYSGFLTRSTHNS